MWIYSKHIFENVNQAKKYLKLNDININDEKYIELKDILNGHTEIVKILLEDERVDPSNYAIRWAYKGGHTEVVKILLDDERVREKLTQEEIEKYEKIT